MATVAQLGARALRKHGLAIVADASRPDSGPPLSTDDIIVRVVHSIGIPVAASERPSEWAPVGEDEVARRALRLVKINPVGTAAAGGTISRADVATRSLRAVGVNPADLTNQYTGVASTFQDVATEALRRLAIIDAIETPSAVDQAEAEKHARTAHDMLTGLGYVDWDVSHIPNWVFEAYVALTANVMAPYFGKAADAATATAAQDMVRMQALTGPIGQTRALAYVGSVHAELAAEELTDWTADSIPDGAADAYVMLVAAALGPMYGRAVDPGEAKARIRRIVLSGARGQTLAVNAVRSAHDGLVRMGVADWPSTAVPAGVADDLAALAASALGPVYGAQVADVFPAALAKIKQQAQVRAAEMRAGEKVASIYAELNALGLIDWPSGQVPAALADAIATMAAALMRADDGKADPAALQAGMLRVRQIAMAGPAGQKVAEQKVRAVHYDWEARGKTRWSIVDIPRYAEEIYVLKAAAWLAPEVGMQANPAWEPQAEMMLSRAIALPSRGEPVHGVYF